MVTRWTERVDVFKCLGLSVVGSVLVLEWLAMRVQYGLRVVADTPTYVALLREMALHPLHPPAPFLAASHGFNIAHATPDLQLAALAWRGLAATGAVPHNMVDTIDAYRLLALKGAFTTLLLVHAAFVWMRSVAGRKVAWLGLAVLPAIWGPALVIFAGDLSFHGFMYASYHSETLAIALLLYALVALDKRFTGPNLAVAQLAVAAVIVTHPFTGVRLAGLAAVLGATKAIRGKDWRLPSAALLGGFALASLWPMYNVSAAMWIGGLNGLAVVVLLALVPLAAASARTQYEKLPRFRIAALESERFAWRLALLGALVAAGVALRELYLFPRHDPDPLIPTNRTSLYWVLHLGTWPFLLGGGAAGIVGLVWLARRGRPLPGIWFAGCFLIGAAGAAGFSLPVWHRFLLFVQLPLALGTAVVIQEVGSRRLRIFIGCTLAASAAFALGTLRFTPPTVTYFGNTLQASYGVSNLIPTGSSVVVASDPQTEYYLLTTGDRVLTESEWHAGSPAETAVARHGYLLVHQLFWGPNWRHAARQMYREGVRYVVVNPKVTLSLPTLRQFSGLRPPLPRTRADRFALRRYYRRLRKIGTHIGNSYEIAVYRLDRRRVFR